MSKTNRRIFAPFSGLRAIQQSDERGTIYFAIVTGILGHWIWEVLVAAAQSGEIDFGNWVVVGSRIGIAFVVGAVSFAGIYQQLANVDPSIRLWFSLTQGFAVDALASPLASTF